MMILEPCEQYASNLMTIVENVTGLNAWFKVVEFPKLGAPKSYRSSLHLMMTTLTSSMKGMWPATLHQDSCAQLQNLKQEVICVVGI